MTYDNAPSAILIYALKIIQKTYFPGKIIYKICKKYTQKKRVLKTRFQIIIKISANKYNQVSASDREDR